MQRDSRATVAQIVSPRPFSTWDLQGCGPACGRRGTERSPANPKLLNGLGEPIWGVRKAIVPLFSLCMAFYVLIMPAFSFIHCNLGFPVGLPNQSGG